MLRGCAKQLEPSVPHRSPIAEPATDCNGIACVIQLAAHNHSIEEPPSVVADGTPNAVVEDLHTSFARNRTTGEADGALGLHIAPRACTYTRAV